MLVVGELQPSSWYELLVTAHNEAGFTEEDYQFATLTPSGGTIPPPLAGTRQVNKYCMDMHNNNIVYIHLLHIIYHGVS